MTKIRLYTPQAPRFTRQWWWDGARNLLFIAVISALVWVYADMEVTKDESFRATIALTSGSSQSLVLQHGPGKIPISFKLRGSRRALAQFRRELEDPEGKNSRMTYDVSRRYGPGKNSIRAEELLEDAAKLGGYSLSVISAVPTSVSFVLDSRVRQTAKVVLDAFGASYADARIDPPEIIVHIAKSDLDALRELQDLPPGEPIRIRTQSVDLREFPTGEEHSKNVDLLPPHTLFPVALEPRSVRVTVKIDQRTDEKSFAVAVWMVFPHTWTEDGTWEEYRIVKKPLEWRPQITVRGPKKDLDRLRSKDIDAQIVLTEDDKTFVESWLPRKVTVRFPFGTDLQIVGDPPTVHFKFEKRTPVPAPVTE